MNNQKILQYELWHECNSMCKFCFLGNLRNKKEDNSKKIESLHEFNRVLDLVKPNEYKTIGIIGGEFFQGQLDSLELKKIFINTIKRMFDFRKNNWVDALWISATLTIGDQKDLFEIVDIAKTYNITNLWICTSWDSEGRFHNKDMENNWNNNMIKLQQYFPTIKINTSIILTEPFLLDYINGRFIPKDFMQKYHTELFFKPAALPREFGEKIKKVEDINILINKRNELNSQFGFEFYPHRTTMLTFFKKFIQQDPELSEKIYTNICRSSTLHLMDTDGHIDSILSLRDRMKTFENFDNSDNNFICGHPIFYTTYNDSNKCFICDKNAIFGENF